MAGLWIRIDLNPDPAFYLNPDPESQSLSPDPMRIRIHKSALRDKFCSKF
jgi:hypothetical protein